MLIELEDIRTKLDVLAGALDGLDAGAIIAATEDLAAAVVLFRAAPVPAGGEQDAKLLMGTTLSQLEAAAMRINLLKDWTRQRIDRGREMRGMTNRGIALSY